VSASGPDDADKGKSDAIPGAGFVRNPRKPDDLVTEIDAARRQREEAFAHLKSVTPRGQLLHVRQAEWHVRGLHYHLDAIAALHQPAIQAVANMAASGTGNLIVTSSPELVDLTYEFGALSGLARIAMNQLLRYCRPSLEIGVGSMPSTIERVFTWETNHPVLAQLQTINRALLRYLIDLRDCLTHDLTLAVGNELLAVEEGFPEQQIPDMQPLLVLGVARVYFRRMGGTSVSVNLSLPDAIYHYDGKSKKLVRPFTYDRVNLVSQSREFVALCGNSVIEALATNLDGKKFGFAPKASGADGKR
jgi:hypothetical protein